MCIRDRSHGGKLTDTVRTLTDSENSDRYMVGTLTVSQWEADRHSENTDRH